VLAQQRLDETREARDFVTLWGTGLGAATQDQVSVMLEAILFPSATPGQRRGSRYRSNQLPGAYDPSIPYGCYVAIALKAEDYTSNIGMLSTARAPKPVRVRFGFTAAQMAQLDAGQSLYLGQVNLYDMVGKPYRNGLM